MHKSLIHRHISIPSNHDATVILQPGNRAFNDPSLSISPKRSAVLSLGLASIDLMRAHQLQAAFFQSITQRIRIIRTIRDKMATMILRQRRLIQRRLDQLRLVWGRACHVHSERKTLAARHHHKLCTFSTFGFPHTEAPFLAGQNVPSAKMFIQWSWPCSSSSWIRAIQACSQTSCSSQSRSRRQHVLGEGKRSGKSFHRAPLRSTQRMPSKHSRLPAGGRPPLAERLACGSNGSIFSHCSSVMISSLAMVRIPFHSQMLHNRLHDTSLY